MAADPQQVMRILGYRGIDVRLQDGNLVARWRFGPMPPDMIPFIRYYKDIIVAELKHDLPRSRGIILDRNDAMHGPEREAA